MTLQDVAFNLTYTLVSGRKFTGASNMQIQGKQFNMPHIWIFAQSLSIDLHAAYVCNLSSELQ